MASRLTVLYGPSGVGKSSLLRAGVASRLRSLAPAIGPQDGAGEIVIVDSWRDDPVAAVAAAAGGRTDLALADALAERALALGGELYLVLDQMEEYVLYHGRGGGPLALELEDVLTRQDVPVHVLLGIRDDALADLDAFKRRVPGLFGNVLRLDHLTRAAARAAIHGPLRAYAELGGVEVSAEDELVEAVLDQVGAGRVERGLTGRGLVAEGRARRVEAPYLQLVLERLWEVERQRGSATLQAATLTELGGATRIVEEHLERALAGLHGEERDRVSQLFNHLVTPSGTKIAHAVDDLARYIGSEAEPLERVLSVLESARILRRVPGRSGGPPRYEIFHDVLADAVLAWRDRHEADRRLREERARAARKHRAALLVAGASLAALALVAGIAAYALTQRAEAREQAESARARALGAEAVSQLLVDPERSVRLALEAAKIEETPQLEHELRRGLLTLRVRAILPGGGGPVTALALSADGERTLVAGASGVARVFETSTGRRLQELRHGGSVTSAALSPDGRTVVTGGADGLVKVWRGSSSTPGVLDHGEPVGAVAVSSSGRVAAAGGTPVVHFWPSPDEPDPVRLRHPQVAKDVLFSPDGRLLAIVAREVYVFDTVTRRRLSVLDQPGEIVVARFSPDSRLVATGGRDDLAVIWNARSGKEQQQLVGHVGDVRDVAFSSGGQLVATASSDNAARVWRVDSGRLTSILASHSNHVEAIAFGADDDVIATGGLDGAGGVWGGVDYTLHAALLGHAGGVTHAAVTPDGSTVVTASTDGSARVWAGTVDPLLPVLARHPPGAASIAFHPAGRLLAVAGMDGVARIVRADGTTVRTLRNPAPLTDVTFSPDGGSVLTAAEDGTARLLRVEDGRLIRSFQHGAALAEAGFDAEGNRIVTAGADGVVQIWLVSGRRVRSFEHGAPATGAAFSPDGSILATAGEDGVARLWRIADGRSLHTLAAHELPLTSVAFSPGGDLVATASYDANVRLWNTATGRVHRVFRGHSAVVSDVSFSPDGRWVLTAGPITAGLWEVEGDGRLDVGHPLIYLRGHGPRVRDAVFAPDSRRIATTGDDGSIRLYACELCGRLDELVRIAERTFRRLGRGLDPNERRQYLGG
jgi:WD40 repeat protein